jgi:hypothetical protein
MDVMDANEAMNQAKAEVGGWMQEFMAGWFAPMEQVGRALKARTMLNNMDPVTRAALQEKNPAAWAKMEARYGE